MTIDSLHRWQGRALSLLLAAASACAVPAAAQGRDELRPGDYIAVVVNQELVTAGEVQRRVERAQADAQRRGARPPPEGELRRQVIDALIEERVIITNARDSGMRVEEAEIDRAIESIAAQNQITLDVLRQRLVQEGLDYARFRANLRDQMMIERLREREVYRRIQISDEDVDKFLDEQRARLNVDAETNLAQILVTVPEGADAATVAERRARIMAALARVQGGEAFDAVAREVSEDGNRQRGGEIGLRPASRLPDIFITATRGLRPGQMTAEPLRSGAGFHLLKVLERKERPLGEVTQTRARHILLRPSAQLSAEVAARRLAEYRRQIESGARRFEDIAREFSEDGSASVGGELGWAAPGVMVPEFEQAMNALPVGGLSAPVVSRFGVHLIQVEERRNVVLDDKQLREQARNVLREQRFEKAYDEWTRELRTRAYVEFREPPQ
jgi:peptidyl-prolyl cis-trans isomerase SurA